MTQIFAYITHKKGTADDSALELISAAKAIDADCHPTAIVLGSADEVNAVAAEMAKSYKEVITVANDALSYPNAEIIRNVLPVILPSDAVLLVTHDTFGMDLSPGLSIKMDAAFTSDLIGFEGMQDGKLKVNRQEYGGVVSTRSLCDISSGAVLNVRAGVFEADESKSESGDIIDKSGDVKDFSTRRTFVEVLEAETGDVDITKSEVLVSVGRGIEEEDNIEMVNELAEAMGADVSCSRPIVDAKWLEKSRQVGTSGQTVKPKVYLAFGISGSFQHMGGLKGNPFIIAVNKNANSPIFQVADIGVVSDILDFIPVLTEKIEDAQ